MPIRVHEEDPALFVEAIGFTSAETGFVAGLIEKDYYCSVLLEDLRSASPGLTFKGGTLLGKVHAGFYRLSEDLDFSISTAPDATKKTRSQSVAPIKTAVAGLADRLTCFRIEEPLTGFNGSTQYNAVVSYESALAARRETIKIEIGVREETMTPCSCRKPRWHAAPESSDRGTWTLTEKFLLPHCPHQEAMRESSVRRFRPSEVAIMISSRY
jgi:hypothetical protein